MLFVGKEVKVKSGQYKNTVGELTSIGGCNTYISLMKKDGVKVKVHYKDIVDVTPVHKSAGKLALLRKSIKLNGKKQTFTLCKIVEKVGEHTNNQMSKIKVETMNREEIVVNCNALLALPY